MESDLQDSIDAVVRRLREGRYERMAEDGEVSIPLLGCMLDTEDGWVGQLMQHLHEAFGDSSPEKTALKLEDAATILVAWAADIRRRTRALDREPAVGETLLVRVPGYRPSFFAEVTAPGEAWISALDQAFPLADLVLLPMPRTPVTAPGASKSLRKELGTVMDLLAAPSGEQGHG